MLQVKADEVVLQKNPSPDTAEKVAGQYAHDSCQKGNQIGL